MILATATVSPLWYLSRSAGYVGLILLGAIGVLGIVTAGNVRVAQGTKFVTPEVHRSLSLLAMVVLAVHVGAAVADKYSFIGIKDVFVPFMSAYRPVWVGFGSVAVDLGIAVVITSLLRVKMGYKSWRLVHWASYPVFALSIIHGLGSGTDSSLWISKVIYLAVGGALVAAIVARLIARKDLRAGAKAALSGMTIAVPFVIVLWALSGPFGANWAKRAQTGLRQSLLASNNVASSSAGATKIQPVASPVLHLGSGYTSNWSGRIDQSPANSQGDVALRLIGNLSNSPGFELSVVLIGTPLDGGISMTSSVVEIASNNGTPIYKGTVTSLQGTTIVSQVANAAGEGFTFSANINLGSNGSSFTGAVAGSGSSSFSNLSTAGVQPRSERGDQ
ncbi:MAG: hypothetical protein EPN30_01795 [Actinomycetota bacterium]|nr:MAG: hypothetical protein EPN30_01795 [Actinomycetota bacterium]